MTRVVSSLLVAVAAAATWTCGGAPQAELRSRFDLDPNSCAINCPFNTHWGRNVAGGHVTCEADMTPVCQCTDPELAVASCVHNADHMSNH